MTTATFRPRPVRRKPGPPNRGRPATGCRGPRPCRPRPTPGPPPGLRRRWLMAGSAWAPRSRGWFGAASSLVPGGQVRRDGDAARSTNPKRIIFDPQERGADYRTYPEDPDDLIKNRRVRSTPPWPSRHRRPSDRPRAGPQRRGVARAALNVDFRVGPRWASGDAQRGPGGRPGQGRQRRRQARRT